MSETGTSTEYHCESGFYEIRIKGHLVGQWTGWFEDMTITLQDNGDTLLTGLVVDQAALYGLLKRVRDLGLPLISVNRFESDPLIVLDAERVDTPDVPAANEE